MRVFKLRKLLLTAVLLPIIIMLLALSVSSTPTLAQEDTGYLRKIRIFENNDIGLSNPLGLTFSFNQGVFFVLESPVDRQTNIVMMTPHTQKMGGLSLDSALTDEINLTFDSKTNQLLFFNDISQQLVKATINPERAYAKPAITALSFEHLNLKEINGMAIDSTTSQLFLLDSAAQQIVQVDLQEGLPGNASTTPTEISRFGLDHVNISDAQSLAFNPINGHLYILNPRQQEVYEITQTGQLVTIYDLASFELNSPQSVIVAPTGDLTDAPDLMSLYIIDEVEINRVSDNLSQVTATTTNQIVELSMSQPVEISSLVPTDVGVLENLTETSLYDPPSPDPAGITYLSNSNSLLISDSEVNEMPIFEGYNLFQTNLDGTLIQPLTTISFSDEPTDVAYNPNNDHLFISDDTGTRSIYELNPGPDGSYNTTDDTVTSFETGVYGSSDSEGVSFNTWNGHLFFTDGLNEEVYDVDPGPNGIFDGTDDIVAQFDVASMGIQDPEGSAFNWHNGHLYVLGVNDLIAEVTTDGTLIRYIDISSLNAERLAGLVYAPASAIPNVYHIYIVARGEDNNQNPNENDGLMFEISFPNNNVPVVDAGVDQTIVTNNTALDGTVTDDGLPSPPGAVTTSWSQISGPGTATFADASAVDTTVTFSVTGTYVLRLSADDSELTGSDDIMVKVLPSGPNQAPTVDAGSPQTIAMPDSAALDGTVTDDGLPYPPSAVTTVWSKLSGPGTVTFADVNAVDTAATFTVAGVYVLRLTADDSELTTDDDVTITVNPPPPQTTIQIRIDSSSDDAEERVNTSVDIGSSDLEFVYDAGGNQTVGMRFNGVNIPPDATILDAYIQFKVDEVHSGATSITLKGQAADNATTFIEVASNISSRPVTAASVNWSPPPWPTIGTSGVDQRTPDISSIVQEIVDRLGWSSGNSLAIIATGTGERTAESYDGDQAGAPLLVISFSTNAPPTVDAGLDSNDRVA